MTAAMHPRQASQQQGGAALAEGPVVAPPPAPSNASAAAPAHSGLLPPLEAQLAASRTSFLQPQAFFVSWQGVLTLAYSGFTDALLDLKQRMSVSHPSLPPENPGSKWPKTSLGCLREGLRLTPEQLAHLCRICSEESAVFLRQAGAAGAPVQQQQQQQQAKLAGNGAAAAEVAGGGLEVAVDSACIALFECRSLERLLSCQRVAFQGGLDRAPPSPEEQQRVAAILAEPSSPSYWFAASRDGNREGHYCSPHLGATLMHPLLPGGAPPAAAAAAAAAAAGEAFAAAKASASAAGGVRGGAADRRALVAAIDRFRRRVDAELPGMYVWFSDASLHITLRALIN